MYLNLYYAKPPDRLTVWSEIDEYEHEHNRKVFTSNPDDSKWGWTAKKPNNLNFLRIRCINHSDLFLVDLSVHNFILIMSDVGYWARGVAFVGLFYGKFTDRKTGSASSPFLLHMYWPTRYILEPPGEWTGQTLTLARFAVGAPRFDRCKKKTMVHGENRWWDLLSSENGCKEEKACTVRFWCVIWPSWCRCGLTWHCPKRKRFHDKKEP